MFAALANESRVAEPEAVAQESATGGSAQPLGAIAGVTRWNEDEAMAGHPRQQKAAG